MPGLFNKFDVKRVDGKPDKPNARYALIAYANSIEHIKPDLYNDLVNELNEVEDMEIDG